MFLNKDEDKIISSGSTDGSIKVWDIRSGRSPSVIASATFATESGITRGITDMKLDSSGQRLFSSCMDNHIYMHYLSDLSKPALKFSDPEYKVGGFDTRISLSPDDRFLLSGSFNKGLFAWEVDHPNAKAQRFEGHTEKVTGVSWSKTSMFQVRLPFDGLTIAYIDMLSFSLQVVLRTSIREFGTLSFKKRAPLPGSCVYMLLLLLLYCSLLYPFYRSFQSIDARKLNKLNYFMLQMQMFYSRAFTKCWVAGQAKVEEDDSALSLSASIIRLPSSKVSSILVVLCRTIKAAKHEQPAIKAHTKNVRFGMVKTEE